MPNFRLSDDLSFCLVDGRPIFLDVARDRYFSLAGQIERMFIDFASGQPCTPSEIDQMTARGLLTDTPSAAGERLKRTPAARSALEIGTLARPTGSAIIEACWHTYRARQRLKVEPLKDTLHGLVARQALETERADERAIREASIDFLSARNLVPIDRCCLLDSIALLAFLNRRGFRADLVFAVTADPFAAHCWAQHNDMVLNDTVGNARAHTVIAVF